MQGAGSLRVPAVLWSFVALVVVALGGPGAARGQAGDPVVAAAGDVACSPADPAFAGGLGTGQRCRMHATSELLVSGGYAAVLLLGDAQYDRGLLTEFAGSYAPTWGRVRAITRPVPGNHEYFGDHGTGYFDYFNGAGNVGGPAGDRDKGYYSFDVGSWHVVALNSVCWRAGGCAAGSPQERWLRADLAAHPAACTLAFFHHPPLSSAGVEWPSLRALWRALHDAGVDVALTGHEHRYERLPPLDAAAGAPDPASGVRLFIVGTGGMSLVPPAPPVVPAEAVDATRFGVLALTLRPGAYDWRFVPATEGTFEDAGTAACHGPPPARAPTVATGPARIAGSASAVVHAAVDPHGVPATYRIEYGRTRAYGSSTPARPLASPTGGPHQVSVRIGGLVAGRRYHYRAVAANGSGTSAGADRSFQVTGLGRYERTVLRTPGLRSFWRFDDAAGALAFDHRGGRLGWAAGPRWAPVRGAIAEDAAPAARFGDGGAGVVLDGPSLSATGTLEAWFRWRAGYALLRDDSAEDGWLLAFERRGVLAYRVAGYTFRTRRAIDRIRDDAWHHLALVKNGDLAKLFVDGRRVHATRGVPSVPATMPWHVMRDGPHRRYAAGAVDAVAVYDRALRRSELRRHYRAGVADDTPDTPIRGPSGPTNERRPVFQVGGGERLSGVRCTLTPAGGAQISYAPCPAQRAYGPLADGAYRFRAYAIDARGHADPTPATRRFVVDTVPPVLQASATPARVALRRRVRAVVRCSEACAATARLSIPRSAARRLRVGAVVGRAATPVAAGAAAALAVGVDARARRRLRRAVAVRATLRVTATDAAGNRDVVDRPLVVSRRGR